MTRRISLVGAVAATLLVVAAPAALADDWGRDRQSGPSIVGSPDRLDHAAAARQQELATMLDARERSQAAKIQTQLGAAAEPDVLDRQLLGDGGRCRIDVARGSATAATIASEPGIQWSQVGLGAGIGILLALGLMLALRATRGGQLAH